MDTAFFVGSHLSLCIGTWALIAGAVVHGKSGFLLPCTGTRKFWVRVRGAPLACARVVPVDARRSVSISSIGS